MSVNYNNPQVLFQPKDKEKELVIAKKFQRKLILSKSFYPYIVFMALLGVCEEYLNLKLSGWAWVWVSVIFVVLGIYSIFSTIILGECPYCHKFQKLNGKTVGTDGTSIFYSSGVSPFIHKCNRCGAPLSEKEVNQFYK